MAQIEVHGNVSGSIVVGDNNFVVNTNHGTIVYKQAAPRVKLRDSAPLPPRPPRSFVGRANELAQLEKAVASNEAVVIFAPDGMGKSALIKQAANGDAARALPNGVVIVEGIDERGEALGPDDVVQRLFDALFESDPPLKVNATTARTYTSHTRPLVVLDGLTLPPALLAALPDLFPKGALLISSTGAPPADSAQPLKLGPLARSEAMALLAARVNVTIAEEDRGELDTICELLSDVPLALVVAGNAIRENGMELHRAKRGLESVSPSASGAAGQAVERAYALAYVTLSPDERETLAAAAIAPGVSVDPEWLKATTKTEFAVERLQSMGLLSANSPRLRIEPGLRAVVTLIGAKRAERWSSEEAGWAQMLSDERPREPASEKVGDLAGHILQSIASDKFRDPQYAADEIGNVLGLIEWSLTERRYQDTTALGRAIDPYLTLHGLWDAWNAVLDHILQAARKSGDRAAEAWALHQLGAREIGAGTRERAISLLRDALDIRRALGDTAGAAYTQHNLNLLIPPPAPPRQPEPKPKPPSGGGILPLIIGLTGIGIAGLLIAAIAGFFLLGSLRQHPEPIPIKPTAPAVPGEIVPIEPTAPPEPHDTTGPEILELTAAPDPTFYGECGERTLTFNVIADDPSGLSSVEVWYRYEGTGAGEWHSAPMIDLGGGAFAATIHNDDQRYAYSALGGQGGVVRWFVRAVDTLDNASKSGEQGVKIEYCLG